MLALCLVWQATGEVYLCAVAAAQLCCVWWGRNKSGRGWKLRRSSNRQPTPIAVVARERLISWFPVAWKPGALQRKDKASGNNGRQMQFFEPHLQARNMPSRHVADQVDGGSASHALECRFFAAQLVMTGQQRGMQIVGEKGKGQGWNLQWPTWFLTRLSWRWTCSPSASAPGPS